MITSLLDTDLYKLTMQNFVLKTYPKAVVTYKFNNRNKDMKFNTLFLGHLAHAISELAKVRLTDSEEKFLREKCTYLDESYIQYLKNYKFDPREVRYTLDDDNNLDVFINGPWHSTILWEVPLMAIISELYFKYCDTDWKFDAKDIYEKALHKAKTLTENRCVYADFGSRRRRSYETHKLVVDAMRTQAVNSFVGTSNVHLAHIFNIPPIGTMAHELIMGVSVLESMLHANRFALEKWDDVYKGNLAVALTDTFGTDAFFYNFDLRLAKLYNVRHDSGDPINFANKVIEKYKSHRIDPQTKTIVFSDGLDVNEAIRIQNHCKGKIGAVFGIGTNFTNDFMKKSAPVVSKPLNMVIKLSTVNCRPVVKISDSPTKAIGDKDALRVAMWTYFGKPLDG